MRLVGAPSILIHGLLPGLNTSISSLKQVVAWMHLDGTQKTVISPLVYCLFLGSLIYYIKWSLFSNKKQSRCTNVQMGKMWPEGQDTLWFLDKASFDALNDVLDNSVFVIGIILGFQVVAKEPGNALPEKSGETTFKFLDDLV